MKKIAVWIGVISIAISAFFGIFRFKLPNNAEAIVYDCLKLLFLLLEIWLLKGFFKGKIKFGKNFEGTLKVRDSKSFLILLVGIFYVINTIFLLYNLSGGLTTKDWVSIISTSVAAMIFAALGGNKTPPTQEDQNKNKKQ